MSFLNLKVRADIFYYQPEQVHLSYGKNVYEIVVTWSTFNDTKSSVVEYGIGGMILQAEGTSKLFIDGGPERHAQYIHRVRLADLTPDSTYGKYSSTLFYFNYMHTRL